MTSTFGRMLAKSAMVAFLCAPVIGAPGAFIRGDATGDGIVDACDAAAIARHVLGGPENPWRFEPPCLDAADVDDDGNVALRDVCALMSFLMCGEPIPAPPFPDPGPDTTPDSLPDAD